MPLPRPEYPRPQFVRDRWQNLNGRWTCRLDADPAADLSGATGFDRPITVPFCPESALSGIGHTDFIETLWLHRTATAPADWAGARIWLNFGGVDWHATVYVNGRRAGEHWGGSAAFRVDLTPFVTPGTPFHLVVQVEDHTASGLQPCGKQSRKRESHGCYYTRVTGIWQTVWLEAVHRLGLESCRIVPNLTGRRLILTPVFDETAQGQRLEATALLSGETVGSATAPAQNGVPFGIDIGTVRPWSPADPFLYDLELVVRDAAGAIVDRARSYAGLRSIAVDGDRLLINGEETYLRFVLDQGYYPDGIWTAPNADALKQDVALAQAIGFNGARLHQKVFEPLYHHWADRMGYLTWAEAPSWSFDENDPVAAHNFLSEWREIVAQVANHPSVIAWTPLNETIREAVGPEHRRFVGEVYDLTRTLDPTRPVNDASGWNHVKTDLWTVHAYDQDPAALAEKLTPAPQVFRNYPEHEAPYEGQPYIVDEFGGAKWPPDGAAGDGWGYGDAPIDEAAFMQRLEGQVSAVLTQPHVRGYCYTQLTDVEQEQNGLYTYDRQSKFDVRDLRAIFSRDP